MKITKLNGAKVDAGDIGENPGMVVNMAVAKKYTLLMRLNYIRRALGRKDHLQHNCHKILLHRVFSRGNAIRDKLRVFLC